MISRAESSGIMPSTWVGGLQIYLPIMLAGNLIWEVAQLPLYTIWIAPLREQAFAVVHCTLGDLLIALSALMLALIMVGNRDWPRQRFWRVTGVAVLLGLGYTAYSEWLNVAVRASWAYSEHMPVIALSGFGLGLSPLLQWVVVPAAAMAMTRRIAARR